MFVRNCWYVAGWDDELPASGFLARTIAGVPIVFWRDSRSKVHALRDRCCHRGAPLSMGRLEADGDRLRCMYHGLLYDTSGQCVSVPAQARIPSQARVQNFPVIEVHRWIWVWMGDPELADPSLIPDTQWLDHPNWCSKGGYLHYSVNYLFITDNLLDLSHIPYLHPNTVGGSPDFAAVLPKVERNDRGVRLTKWVRNTKAPAYSARYGGYGDNDLVDRWMFYDLMAPGILLMDSGMMPVGSELEEPQREGNIAFRGCQAVTPETETSSHYFFAHPRNFLLDDPRVTEEIYAGLVQAFGEDRAMIHAQQANLARDPSFSVMPLSVDIGLSQFRFVVDKLMRAEGSLDTP